MTTMDNRMRSFIEKATLLFIASRNAEGAMDVSPRGGQPSVVRLRDDGSLLLPDYVGNRRLDTIGNLLSNPDVALVLLNRRSEEYLRIAASAIVSQSEEDIAAFPADENRPLSVIVLTPTRMEFVPSKAFTRSGFWIDPADRKPPLDVLDIYARDGRWQAEGGRKPVLYDAASESRLAEAGLRDFYGTPSPLVQNKVYNTAGPGFMGFIDDARFIVFAHEGDTGEILMDLVGGSPLQLDPDTNRQSLLLDLSHEGSAASRRAAFGRIRAAGGRTGPGRQYSSQRGLSRGEFPAGRAAAVERAARRDLLPLLGCIRAIANMDGLQTHSLERSTQLHLRRTQAGKP
jgi:predicted pyridoxine 5'-phosphate oxidase superfamily flavin-nucleotide-binding protein